MSHQSAMILALMCYIYPVRPKVVSERMSTAYDLEEAVYDYESLITGASVLAEDTKDQRRGKSAKQIHGKTEWFS